MEQESVLRCDGTKDGVPCRYVLAVRDINEEVFFKYHRLSGFVRGQIRIFCPICGAERVIRTVPSVREKQ